MKKKLLEQDMPAIPEPEKKETEIPLDKVELGGEGDAPSEDGKPEEDLDLEKDYQYTLTFGTKEKTDADIEPEAVFYLRKKEEENPEAIDSGLEEIENIEGDINQEQAPTASVDPLQKESVSKEKLIEAENQELQPLEQQSAPVDAPTAPDTASPDATEVPAEDAPELEEEENPADAEFSEEDLKTFIESLQDQEIEFFINDETKFNLDEALDYLRLYPDSDIFVSVPDVEAFETKMGEFKTKTEELNKEASTEDQNVMVDQSGDSVDLNQQANQVQPETPGGVKAEGFSIFNIKGSKKLPDGVYLANLSENMLYGQLKDIKLTKNSMILEKVNFALSNDIDTAKVLGMEEISITLKENTDKEKLLKLLENSEIKLQLTERQLETQKIDDYEVTFKEDILSDGSKVYNIELYQEDKSGAFPKIEFPCTDERKAMVFFVELIKLLKSM
jgi:hypothetical protein